MPPKTLSFNEGYDQALTLIRQCATTRGFLASTTRRDNYHRVWARDGIIIGLASLLTGDEELRDTFLATLRTLKTHQGPHGEIPSNVDPETVSYGGTTGRVDADLWYIIGCASYYRATRDAHFLDEFLQSLERVQFLLGAWEFNTRGLLYVPQTGDWTDEYVQQGYVLYDQVLYWRALKDLAQLHSDTEGHEDFLLNEKAGRLRELIASNYWFGQCDADNPNAYHLTLFRKICADAAEHAGYWIPFFSPNGYGYRFDAFANALISLLGIASPEQSKSVDSYISANIVRPEIMLLPAFHPAIQPGDDTWQDLQFSYSYSFKNRPYEFHNGGLWPLVTGFYVADLAKRGQTDLASAYADGIDRANRMDTDDDEWGFYEFIHGRDDRVGGTRHLGWSAAGAVIARHALQGSFVL